MTAGIVFVIALMLLVTQLMGQGRTGEWPSVTLASQFNIPAERVFSDWMMLDRPIHYVLGDVQLWIVLVFMAAMIYWVTDFIGEQLNRLSKRAPPPELPQPELAQSSDSL
jgi:hypothetical protein